jgi:peroxiredoxin
VIRAHNPIKEDRMGQPPAPNTRAPEFDLPDAHGNLVRLRRLRGHKVVLAFYPGDWTPACSSELSLIQETLDEIHTLDAEVLAISCDSVHSHRAWADELNLTFPLLSDFWPHGEVSRRYGLFRDDDGTSDRALLFLDDLGVLRESWVAVDPEIAPGLNVLFDGLNHLQRRAGGEAHA